MCAWTNYSPVDLDFEESLKEMASSSVSGVVNFFNGPETLSDVRGVFESVQKREDGVFLKLDEGEVRIDLIVTILGKPGPSYDRYNHFSNVCFSCFDEGQF